MRVAVGGNRIRPLVIREKKEYVGPFLGRQEGARKNESQQ